jgi:DNA-binding CsgD family transcriptional regulator
LSGTDTKRKHTHQASQGRKFIDRTPLNGPYGPVTHVAKYRLWVAPEVGKPLGSNLRNEVLWARQRFSAYGVIAEHLHVSYKTVANTCTQLKAKLGLRTLPELMRIAIQHLPSAASRTR